jgi:hypothetical protein
MMKITCIDFFKKIKNFVNSYVRYIHDETIYT